MKIYTQPATYEVKTIPLIGELSNFVGSCILQDSDGFIWFGSQDGLYRYDGAGMKTYRYAPDDSNSISNNRVQAIIEDNEGLIWIGTAAGLNKFDKYRETFQCFPGDRIMISLQRNRYNIGDITEDKDGCLWLSNNVGCLKFDKKNETFKDYRISREDTTLNRQSYRIFSTYPARDGYLWMQAEVKLYRMDIETESIEHITDGWMKPRFEDNSGRLWFAGSGLYLYDEKNRRMVRYLHEPDNPNRLHHQGIRAMLEDKRGNLWIRTHDGIYCYSQDLELIYSWKHDFVYSNTPDYKFSEALMEDNTGAIWFYTKDGINQIIKINRNFNVYDPDPETNSFINCILVENKNLIWFGALNGIYSLDRKNNTFTRHYGESYDVPAHPQSADGIFMDRNGSLWIAMRWEGLFRMIKSEDSVKQFVRYSPASFGSRRQKEGGFHKLKNMFEDSQGRLWLSGGKRGNKYYDKDENRILHLVDNPSARDSLPLDAHIKFETDSNIFLATGFGLHKVVAPFIRISESEVMASDVIKCLAVNEDRDTFAFPMGGPFYRDSAGNLWLGSLDQGLIKVSGQSISSPGATVFKTKSFNTSHGLADNRVQSILPDAKGNLWIGTLNGLSKFDPQSETFNNYYVRHGLPINAFRMLSADQGIDGELFFGTEKGMISFYPDSVRANDHVAPVVLTDLKLHNQSIYPGENSVLQKSITFTEKIELRHNQNYLSFEFAILNYLETELNQYKYKLEGLDEDWVYSGSRNFVNYSNLKPGDYTFLATGANNNGIWNPEGVSLGITIHYPPWMMWWAFLIYFSLLTGIILWYRRYMQIRAGLRTAIELERIENEKIRELDQMKSRFFANISHEFRTPLTLIRGPLDELNKNRSETITLSREILSVMRRNTGRLQRLIDQLLDISKLETGKVTLKVSEGILEECVRPIVLSFLSLAESRQISYEYDIPETPHKAYFDPDIIEKILTNLISNAFKYTPAKGEVSASLHFVTSADPDTAPSTQSVTPQFVEIKVSDTGKGIPEDQVEKIFDRFYQVPESDTLSGEGKGIGLALTRELVVLCRGEIEVKSEVGRGSTFSVRLPVSRDKFTEEEIVQVSPGEAAMKKPFEAFIDLEEPLVSIEEAEQGETVKSQSHENPGSSPVILIVEDNIDLRNYIYTSLGESYQILTAENGERGLESVIENLPDLVISDLMMPLMDGMEMCRQLKQDDRCSHIPVIMLTARADKQSKIEGLTTGADDFIIKPFDAEELKIRVRNLIDQRKKLRDKFMQEFLTEPDYISLLSPGDHLLEKIMDLLNQNVGEPGFSIDRMPEKLNMSRAQLFRKVQSLTGYTPNDLLRRIRLKKAASLFNSGQDNVSIVMHEVGFSNHSYFAKCFRELYGVNPSEYMNR